MSKAIEGVGMLAGAVGIGALIYFTGGAALAAAPWLAEVMGGLVLGGAGAEAAAIAGALTSNRGMNITTRQVASPRQIIYGTQRVGGTIIYRSVTGHQLNYCIVIAGHTCHSIEALYLDGRKVYFDSTSVGSSTRNGVTFGGHANSNNYIGPDGLQYGFGNLVYCEARYGDQQPGDVISSFTANDPVWAATSDGRSPWVGGCTYVYLKITNDPTAFPGEPEIRFTVNGRDQIFDPRTSTSGFSTNWALIVADILSNSQFGLSAVYGTDVNNAQLIAAANLCDESVSLANGTTEARYSCGTHYDTSTAPGDVLQGIMATAGGRLSFVGGEWFVFPGAYVAPTLTFTENDLVAPFTEMPQSARRDLCNRITGQFTSPNYPYNPVGNLYDANGWYDGTRENTFALQFQPTSFPAYSRDKLHGYASNIDLDADLGRLLVKDIDLKPCLSLAQAQRCAKIAYMRTRAYQYKVTLPMALRAYQLQPNDTFTLNLQRFGMSKTLEVLSTRFTVQPAPDAEDSRVPVLWVEHTCQETGPDVYAWDCTTEELTIYDESPGVMQTNASLTVGPPVDLVVSTYTSTGSTSTSTTSNGTTSNLSGTATNYALAITWTTPDDGSVTGIEVQAKLSSNSTWFDAGTASVASSLAYIYGINHGSTYDVQIRSVRANGGTSVWVQQLNFTA